MRLFTDAQVRDFRHRIRQDAEIVAVLKQSIDTLQGKLLVPETGIASWSGYYVCPEHSVPLQFDISSSLHHKCPVDGTVWTGEKYNHAWWRIVNDKNAAACYHAALLFLLTGEAEYLAVAKRLLLAYAARYPYYEVHGDIPYNNPGRVNAQTLCDAQWTRPMAMAFDIIRTSLTAEEQELVTNVFLKPTAEFLLQYRTRQIHNHEAVISSCIGVLGFILEEKSYIEEALYAEYGLCYQLEHGLLQDGLWFEGTPAYHYYCLQQFIDFEYYAHGTPYSFFLNPAFLKALTYPLRLQMQDHSLPLLNDTKASYDGFQGAARLYELPYALTKNRDIAALLCHAYKNKPRCSLEAFFFGAPEIPPVEMPPARCYHAGAPGSSGLTILHGPGQRSLLVKHSPFSGEHDHYDRLALHYVGLGKQAAADIGTSEYGAPLHYSYYKSTLTHNTVCLNGANHPPTNCRTLAFREEAGNTLLDVQACWDGSYQPLDSFVIPQWQEDVYMGASLRRVIAWYGEFLIDVFQVTTPQERTIDWMLHVRGARAPHAGETPIPKLWSSGPGTHLHSVCTAARQPGPLETTWDLGDNCELRAYTLAGEGVSCHYALGPDNPSVQDMAYMVQRAQGTTALFLNVLCIQKSNNPCIRQVALSAGQQNVAVAVEKSNGETVRFAYTL